MFSDYLENLPSMVLIFCNKTILPTDNCVWHFELTLNCDGNANDLTNDVISKYYQILQTNFERYLWKLVRINGGKSSEVWFSLETQAQVQAQTQEGCRTLADFFVVQLHFFCRDRIGLKFVGPTACRTLADI